MRAMETPASDLPSELLEHAAFARRLARALVADASLAEDVVQQSFVSALERPPRLGAGLRGWLSVVVRRTASKLLRGRRRAALRDERFAATRREAQPATVDVAAQLDAQRALLDAVARLEPIYRDALHERFFLERAPKEIAAAAGVPARTIETRIRRGLERLRESLLRRSDGGGEAWIAALAPLLGASSGVGGSIVKTATKAKLAKLAAAAVVLAAVGGVGLALRQRAKSEEGVARGASPETAPAPATRVDAERSEARTAPTAVAAAAGAIEVLLPDATPASGASIAIVADTKMVANGKAGSDGRFTWTEPGTPTIFVAYTNEAPPQWIETAALKKSEGATAGAAADATTWRWTLAQGSLLTGRVFVDGAAPESPIRLVLNIRHPLGLPPDLFAIVHGLVNRPLDALSDYMATTDAAGRFRFFGFEPATSGSLEPLAELDWEGPSPSINGLPRDVEVRLKSRPIWKGRLVDEHGAAAAGYTLRFSSHRGQPEGADARNAQVTANGTTSDAEGRFQFALVSAMTFGHGSLPLPEHVPAPTIFVNDPSETYRGCIDFDGNRPNHCDLGDVVLPPARDLTITLHDETGAAVAVARLELKEAGFSDVHGWRDEWLHAKFPAQGEVTHVAVARAARHLRVLAAGHLPKCVDLPEGEATTSVVVELPRTSELVLRAEAGDGAAATGVRFELRSPEWPYAGEPRDSWALESEFGHRFRRWLTWTDDGGVSQSTPLDEKGEWRLAGVKAGIPLTFVARDEAGDEIRRDVVTLAAGERREVVVGCDRGRALEGRVIDEEGHPVRGSEIHFTAHGAVLEDRGAPPKMTRADADGTFRLPALVATNGTLVVVANGFALARVDVDAGAETPVEVKLRRTRSLYVSLASSFADGEVSMDPDVAGVEGWVTRPSPRGDAATATRPTDGGLGRLVDRRHQRLRFDDLPSGALEVHLRVNGTTISGSIAREMDPAVLMLSVLTEVDVKVTLTEAGFRDGNRLREIRLIGADASVCARAADVRSLPPIDVRENFAGVPSGRRRLELVWWSVPRQRLEVETTDVEIDVVAGRRAEVNVTR
jgi:RNA polymerase sigma factor (sigma-70 family)